MTDQAEIGPRDFTEALREAQDALAAVRPDRSDTDGGDTDGEPTAGRAGESGGASGKEPDLCGEGEAAEGSVRAVVRTDGRIGTVTLDQKALRLPVEDLGAAVVMAVNAARQDLAAIVREQPSPDLAGWDPERLLERQQESAQQMGALADKLSLVMERVARASDR